LSISFVFVLFRKSSLVIWKMLIPHFLLKTIPSLDFAPNRCLLLLKFNLPTSKLLVMPYNIFLCCVGDQEKRQLPKYKQSLHYFITTVFQVLEEELISKHMKTIVEVWFWIDSNLNSICNVKKLKFIFLLSYSISRLILLFLSKYSNYEKKV
jgi:hypothetical protein